MSVGSFAYLLTSMILPGIMFFRASEGDQFDKETVLAIFEGLAGQRE